jgi:hypothetical protein
MRRCWESLDILGQRLFQHQVDLVSMSLGGGFVRYPMIPTLSTRIGMTDDDEHDDHDHEQNQEQGLNYRGLVSSLYSTSPK